MRVADAVPVRSCWTLGQETAEAEHESGKLAPKKKMCCACPETKKLRDECLVINGEQGGFQ